MAKEYPALVRRAHAEGHSIGTHSMTHPVRFRALSVERANAQIDDGIAATAAALGDPDQLAPFFRFPGFGHTGPAHAHAASRGLMVWGADVPADDWHRLGPREVARRAVQRLEHKGKGILLLHDIHQRTVDALPLILEELKARGFRIVHVVPANDQRAPTVTTAEAWLPHSGPKPTAPLIRLAALQELDAGILMKKSAEELCSLTPLSGAVHRAAGRGRARMARIAQAEVGQAKPAPAKAMQAQVAHGGPSATTKAHGLQ
jgi:hypothetical protein